jgi:hypothetical protein
MKPPGPFQPPYFTRRDPQPKTIRLLWALPLVLLILVLNLEIGTAAWYYTGDRTQKNIDYVYPGLLQDYIFFGILAVLPILLVNWSRRFWPRLASALTLLAVEVSIGSWLILSTRLPAQ